MYNPDKSCILIKFAPVSELSPQTQEFLEETFDVIAVNYTDGGLEQYVGYAPLDFNKEELITTAEKRNLPLPPFEIETLKATNWLTENVIKFPPFEIGRFLIYGIHEASCPKTRKIPVQVYAATAFGSEHQTTKMCLTAISELAGIISAPKKILDMGTGSGILSIAAAKIWNGIPEIIAADIDPESVDVTNSNALTNGAENSIAAVLSNGYENPAIKDAAPYDLIFSNILANPLKEMAPKAYECLAPNGCYLTSGFIENQETELQKYHEDLGFNTLKTYQIDNWRAILFKKVKE